MVLLSSPVKLGIEPIVQPPKPEPKVIITAKRHAEIKTQRTYIKVELTAYCNCYKCTQNSKDKGRTASGTTAHKGTIAAPRNIPYGTKFIINGKEYTVEDRGGAIVARKDGVYVFDIWVPTHKDTIKFGRVKTQMYLENGKYYINY